VIARNDLPCLRLGLLERNFDAIAAEAKALIEGGF
jgi:hypothetical protein